MAKRTKRKGGKRAFVPLFSHRVNREKELLLSIGKFHVFRQGYLWSLILLFCN